MPVAKGSTRRRVAHLLKRTGGASAPEIARALGVTAVAIRKHLGAMRAEGLVTLETCHRGRGRPSLVYRLSEAGESLFPQGYHQLVVDLLQDLSQLEGDEKLEHLFRLRNERLARTYQLRLAGKSFAEAVYELARARDDDGYMATVEETERGLVLAEHNCPIYDVAQRFPQACACEQALFERVLNVPVRREETQVEGAPACRYHIAASGQ